MSRGSARHGSALSNLAAVSLSWGVPEPSSYHKHCPIQRGTGACLAHPCILNLPFFSSTEWDQRGVPLTFVSFPRYASFAIPLWCGPLHLAAVSMLDIYHQADRNSGEDTEKKRRAVKLAAYTCTGCLSPEIWIWGKEGPIMNWIIFKQPTFHSVTIFGYSICLMLNMNCS